MFAIGIEHTVVKLVSAGKMCAFVFISSILITIGSVIGA